MASNFVNTEESVYLNHKKFPKLLRHFSKITCFSTLFLIFAGGMVTSTESGLAVPDWPLSYGMVFPPMVGGVFYEHGHRMIATLVGFFVLCLAIGLGLWEKRAWVKTLGFVSLGAVIAQGILGGITVLFFLPTIVSVFHAILAQTFFILTIIIAYTQSNERKCREQSTTGQEDSKLIKEVLIFGILIYSQLIIAAIMRHTGSGLAIPDFPKAGGMWLPMFNADMLFWINDWRFEMNLDPVNMAQVAIHFLHRVVAFVILIYCIFFTKTALKIYANDRKILISIYTLNLLIITQICLGILTIWTGKAPVITSLHVVTGAATLGFTILLLLRVSPLQWTPFKLSLR